MEYIHTYSSVFVCMYAGCMRLWTHLPNILPAWCYNIVSYLTNKTCELDQIYWHIKQLLIDIFQMNS